MKEKRKIGRGVCVIGAGMSKFGMFPDKDSKELFVESFKETVESVDKGFDPNDIDALYLGNFSNDYFVHQGHWAPIIADAIGHTPKPATRTECACAASALAFKEGVFAIASGFYDIVLVGGVEEMSKCNTAEVTEGLAMAAFPSELVAGFTFPGIFGAIGSAYFAKYGCTKEDLFNITIKSHNNAKLNPKAQLPFTIRDMMNQKIAKAKKKGRTVPFWNDEKEFLRDPKANPVVAYPMSLYDCCPISDGASSMILCSEEIARRFTDNPLYVIGIGQGSGGGLQSPTNDNITSLEATRFAAAEAYSMAGLSPKDIQFSEVHDCFSMAEVIDIEDLGFFKHGEAYKAINEGQTKLDGSMPINTSGGLKCKGHPVGATGTGQLHEVWEQLRGEAGERQIPNKDLKIGAAHNLGGTGGTCTFTILERR
ncbi:MAG: hypothetical protein J7L90_00085 [Dehalococcoidia bacterium]|nr:hypothetical protein [Dehalococcoidia bacterium]